MPVRGQNQLLPAERAHKHQQARLRQVEIREQRTGGAKPEAGRNEQIGFAFERAQGSGKRNGFDGPNAGSSHTDEPARRLHFANCFLAHFKIFFVQLHFFNGLGP